ncbi:glycosyl transferases group 1 family protein, partial [Bacteroides fragilis str. 3783N1-2]
MHLALPLSKQFIKKWQLNNKKAWLFVGRLVEIKGLDRVLKAFASAKIDTDTVLILVGEGELLETLKSQAKNLKISDRVLFVGRY